MDEVEQTGCFNKPFVMLRCQKRIWKFAEKLLEQSSNAVYVVEEAFWVSEINLGGICH